MEALLSAVASELIGRCVSFLIGAYRRQAAVSDLARLHRLLLRARVVVEEAEGRRITNRGMLLQLELLREGMYRGYHVLDAFTTRAAAGTRRRRVALSLTSSSSSPSSFDTANGGEGTAILRSSGDGAMSSKLGSVVDSLEAALGDMREFVVFLSGYPRVVRQPCSAYLYVGRCMFGRHGERERVIDFLLRSPCSFPGVLPVTGPPEVGKKTLVEHVCDDERVRGRFRRIMHLCGDDLGDDDRYRLLGSEHHQEPAASDGGSSLLIIVEFNGEVDEAAWGRFYSAISNTESSSKVIAISRTEQVTTLGTSQALRLTTLPQEEFWYFFRALAFGGADPGDSPELASIAMDLVREIRGSFMAANILARLMHSAQNARFWRRVLGVVRHGVRANYTASGEHPSRLPGSSRLAYLCGVAEDAPLCLYYDWCKLQSGTAPCRRPVLRGSELPKVTLQDVLDGDVVPRGEERIDVLVWRSPIPPYYNYVANCAVEKEKRPPARTDGRTKRKRVL